MRRLGMTWRIVPLRTPSKARKGAPASAEIVTGEPVNAACSMGSRYMSNRRSGEAGSEAASWIVRGMVALLRSGSRPLPAKVGERGADPHEPHRKGGEEIEVEPQQNEIESAVDGAVQCTKTDEHPRG